MQSSLQLIYGDVYTSCLVTDGIAEFAGLEINGLEIDGLEFEGLEFVGLEVEGLERTAN